MLLRRRLCESLLGIWGERFGVGCGKHTPRINKETNVYAVRLRQQHRIAGNGEVASGIHLGQITVLSSRRPRGAAPTGYVNSDTFT
jgi:hypothetical protein